MTFILSHLVRTLCSALASVIISWLLRRQVSVRRF